MNKFNEIIKELREKQGITQEQLADALDVSRGTVGMWETGKRRPSQELYEKIADMFNVDMDYLYGRTNIKKARHYDEQGNEYVASYYLNEETQSIAQEIFENPDLRALFDASRNAKPEDLEIVKNLMLDLKRREKS